MPISDSECGRRGEGEGREGEEDKQIEEIEEEVKK